MSLKDGYHDIPSGKVAMVVTHLEMTSPAPLRGVALPEGLCFEHLPREPELYRDLFRRVGQEWLWFERLGMDDLVLCSIIEHDDVALWTLTKNGRAEAILELDFRAQNTCELAYFGLSAPLIGTGAGRFLMDRAIEMAWAKDISRFHVHTCTLDSPQALPFYIRSGFTPTRRQIEIDNDPRALGLLPEQAAPQVPRL